MGAIFIKRSYINIRMLLRVIGWLLLIEALFMAVPTIVSFVIKPDTAMPFLISCIITGIFGIIFTRLKSYSREMGKREAILLTGMTWVILSLFGMLPFLLSGTHHNITDAFFETMSGFTTTGASVMCTLTDVPPGILLWRCIVQWIGGLGIILFTLAVVPMLNYKGGIQLFNAEVTGITHDKLRPRVSTTAKGLWLVYIVLTALLILLLSFSDMDIFNAVCYGLSTMSTGGFATNDMTLGEWASLYVKIVFIIFMFLGGVNFSLLFNAATGKIKGLLHNDALKWYLYIIGICYVALCLNVALRGLVHDVADITIDPLFQAVSILSSTGLTEPDFSDWGPLSMIVLVGMMFIGACAGSTSGGAKIDRVIILMKFIKNEFYKMIHPNAVTTVVINKKGTPQPIVNKVLAFLSVYLMVILIGLVILVLTGLPLKDSFFCSLSAISNTGLGTDITGISGNYAYVHPVAKWTLSLIMLTGRLELYTILLLFTPGFWRK